MPSADSPGPLARFTSLFYRNWISLAGFILSVSAAFAFLFLFGIDLFAHGGNPYMGILAYLVAPGFFFLGGGLVAKDGLHYRKRREDNKGTGE